MRLDDIDRGAAVDAISQAIKHLSMVKGRLNMDISGLKLAGQAKAQADEQARLAIAALETLMPDVAQWLPRVLGHYTPDGPQAPKKGRKP